jgi:hypothetical protein
MFVLHRLKLLRALRPSHFLLCFPLRSFTVKGIFLHDPLKGLNLNRQSVSELEPEMPVTLDGVGKQHQAPAVLTL